MTPDGPTDDLNLRVLPQPLLNSGCAALRQQVGYFPPLQIHQDRSVAAIAFPPCPVVHAHYPNGLRRRTRLRPLLDPAQERVIADRQAQSAAQPLTRTAAQSVRNLLHDFAEALGFSRMLVADTGAARPLEAARGPLALSQCGL